MDDITAVRLSLGLLQKRCETCKYDNGPFCEYYTLRRVTPRCRPYNPGEKYGDNLINWEPKDET